MTALGPHTWCLTCHAAAGARQSPINIVKHNCIYDAKLSPIKLVVFHNSTQLFTRKKHNFQVSFKSNNGEFIIRATLAVLHFYHMRILDFHFQSGAATTVEGGPLKGKYNLQQFHCHWGCEDEWGSEHHVDGQSFAGELHLVFMNEKYSTMDQAVKDSEGLCVIGVFLKVVFCLPLCESTWLMGFDSISCDLKQLQADYVECEAMKPLIGAIKSSKPGCEQPITDEIDLHSLIPSKCRVLLFTLWALTACKLTQPCYSGQY